MPSFLCGIGPWNARRHGQLRSPMPGGEPRCWRGFPRRVKKGQKPPAPWSRPRPHLPAGPFAAGRPQGGIHRALHQRLHFRGARIEFQERLLRHGVGILQQELIAAVDKTGNGRFELGCSLGHRFVQTRVDLRLPFARHSFHKFLRSRQFAPQLHRLFLQALRHLLRLAAVLFHLFFPVRGDLAGEFLLRGSFIASTRVGKSS